MKKTNEVNVITAYIDSVKLADKLNLKIGFIDYGTDALPFYIFKDIENLDFAIRNCESIGSVYNFLIAYELGVISQQEEQ